MTRKPFRIVALLFVAAVLSLTIAGLALADESHPEPDDHGSHNSPNVEYTLITGVAGGKMAFTGVGGAIDGVVNPTLTADPGDTVQITLINGDAMMHDLVIDELAHTEHLTEKDTQSVITFTVNETGEYIYYCSIPGHKQAGMWGELEVGESDEQAAEGVSIVRNPSDVPAPIGDREAKTVQVDLVSQEVVGQLADGTTITYFTFNGTVPGPMFRVRVGDTVEVNFANDASSQYAHSVDFHAVTGPGGGAVFTNIAPGAEASFTFKALNPGLYVYHCATPSVAHHITSGMYGMILVEPEGGLEPVDREFYVMQGEIYTAESFGTHGHLNFSEDKMLSESPEYFVFNGAAGGLTADENAMRAAVGETVRIFFGVGGPNFTSSFHVIGEIFDRVYDQGTLTSPPLTNVQTTLVPPGGATVVEFALQVPGRYILVDHALSRMERGLAGYLYAEGDPQPEIFDGVMVEGSGH